LEVVTGEYGNFTSQLKTAAIDDKSWRTPPQIADSRNIRIYLSLMPYVFNIYLIYSTLFVYYVPMYSLPISVR